MANWRMWQRLDGKTLQRLEAAVAKSEYSQGKKLKVITKVRFGCSLHRLGYKSRRAISDTLPRYKLIRGEYR